MSSVALPLATSVWALIRRTMPDTRQCDVGLIIVIVVIIVYLAVSLYRKIKCQKVLFPEDEDQCNVQLTEITLGDIIPSLNETCAAVEPPPQYSIAVNMPKPKPNSSAKLSRYKNVKYIVHIDNLGEGGTRVEVRPNIEDLAAPSYEDAVKFVV